jgi:hypothetical protein
MLRLALITSVGAADLGADGDLLLPELGRLGIAGIPVGWGVDLTTRAFDGAVIRSASDYVDHPRRFLDWCRETSNRMPLANPVDVLAWNSDKRYLRDLERTGVAVVPTLWLGPGETLTGIRWERFVVKPVISAGARASATYGRSGLPEARRHVDAITAGGVTAMVQPHLTSIDREGEVGVYVIGGEVSHAIRKAGVLRAGAPPARTSRSAVTSRWCHPRSWRSTSDSRAPSSTGSRVARIGSSTPGSTWPAGRRASCFSSSSNASSPASSWSMPRLVPERLPACSRRGWSAMPVTGSSLGAEAGAAHPARPAARGTMADHDLAHQLRHRRVARRRRR